MIYTISNIFNQFRNEERVRTARLIEDLARNIMFYYFDSQEDSGFAVEKHLNGTAESKKKMGRRSRLSEIHEDASNPRYYVLGSIALELLCDCSVIELYDKQSDELVSIDDFEANSAAQMHKHMKQSYAKCKIPPASLPLKCNIPMIYPPRPWVKVKNAPNNLACKTNADSISFYLDVGYLLPNKFLSVIVYHFLSSKNLVDFRITRVSNRVLHNVSMLQSIPFKNDKKFLDFLFSNQELMVQLELLNEPSLRMLSVDESVKQKRAVAKVNSLAFNYNDAFLDSQKVRNAAQWEYYRFELFKMLDGLTYYFPAFIDFRGRIYRTGLVTPHERELIRASTCFALTSKINEEEQLLCKRVLKKFIGYHIKRCNSNAVAEDAIKPYLDDSDKFDVEKIVREASHPALAARCALWYNSGEDLHLCPLSTDASSSAYQFMSYLTCDEDLAFQTNLFESDKIQDLYSNLGEGSEGAYLNEQKIEIPADITIDDLTRRSVLKAAYMPLLYGKSTIALSEEIKNDYFKEFSLSKKESFKVAKIFVDYGDIVFAKHKQFMKLCASLANLCATLDKALYLDNAILGIAQDYRKTKKTTVYVFDPKRGSKKRITLTSRTQDRDPLKAARATTANLVHSLDALVAQEAPKGFHRLYPEAPIYTIHDCFVTSALYVEKLPEMYIRALLKLGSPVQLINHYIAQNLFKRNTKINLTSIFTEETLDKEILLPDGLDTRRRQGPSGRSAFN